MEFSDIGKAIGKQRIDRIGQGFLKIGSAWKLDRSIEQVQGEGHAVRRWASSSTEGIRATARPVVIICFAVFAG
jgi:hypothetical protein